MVSRKQKAFCVNGNYLDLKNTQNKDIQKYTKKQNSYKKQNIRYKKCKAGKSQKIKCKQIRNQKLIKKGGEPTGAIKRWADSGEQIFGKIQTNLNKQIQNLGSELEKYQNKDKNTFGIKIPTQKLSNKTMINISKMNFEINGHKWLQNDVDIHLNFGERI